jgi:putative ABC transport system permease protein
MNAATIASLAIGRILATKTRSFLTMLGVIIGVASLVALTSLASGATSGINDSLSSLGAQQVTVSASQPDALDESDAAAIEELSDVSLVSVSTSGQGAAVFNGTEAAVSLSGVDDAYAESSGITMAVGSFLPSNRSDRSVVLSATAANDLGVVEDDIGATVRLDGVTFTLVGVAEDAGGFGVGGTAYVGLDASRSLFAAAPYVSSITVTAASEEVVTEVQSAVDTVLRDRAGLSADDDAAFTVTNQSSLLDTLDSVQQTLSLLLIGIASISLVVGGIGIMNIMLVSVRERTREIGVRRAIGAKRGTILIQFLLEAVVLSLLGGVIGLIVGIGVSAIIAAVAGWAFTISTTTLLIALGFSALVGIVFGVWPARTASRLQPVDALRFE